MRTAISRALHTACEASAAALARRRPPAAKPQAGVGHAAVRTVEQLSRGLYLPERACWQDGAGGSSGTGSGHGGSAGAARRQRLARQVRRHLGVHRRPARGRSPAPTALPRTRIGPPWDEIFDVSAGPAARWRRTTTATGTWTSTRRGTSTVIRPGATCSRTDDPVTPPVTYTWHGEYVHPVDQQRPERNARRATFRSITPAPPVPGRARCTSAAP